MMRKKKKEESGLVAIQAQSILLQELVLWQLDLRVWGSDLHGEEKGLLGLTQLLDGANLCGPPDVGSHDQGCKHSQK